MIDKVSTSLKCHILPIFHFLFGSILIDNIFCRGSIFSAFMVHPFTMLQAGEMVAQ